MPLLTTVFFFQNDWPDHFIIFSMDGHPKTGLHWWMNCKSNYKYSTQTFYCAECSGSWLDRVIKSAWEACIIILTWSYEWILKAWFAQNRAYPKLLFQIRKHKLYVPKTEQTFQIPNIGAIFCIWITKALAKRLLYLLND